MKIVKTAAPTLIKANIRTTRIVSSWPITPWIEGRREIWEMAGQDMPTEIDCAYNSNGDYVGDLKFAKFLAGRCIRPEKRNATINICSIGFSVPENSWYGWSHRACISFTLGDRVFEEAYGDDNTLFTQHGAVEITHIDQARIAACAFADYIG